MRGRRCAALRLARPFRWRVVCALAATAWRPGKGVRSSRHMQLGLLARYWQRQGAEAREFSRRLRRGRLRVPGSRHRRPHAVTGGGMRFVRGRGAASRFGPRGWGGRAEGGLTRHKSCTADATTHCSASSPRASPPCASARRPKASELGDGFLTRALHADLRTQPTRVCMSHVPLVAIHLFGCVTTWHAWYYNSSSWPTGQRSCLAVSQYCHDVARVPVLL